MHNTLTAEDTQDIYYKDVFGLYSLLRKIYSDQGLQFTAWIIQILYKHLSIESSITTTYHSKGNSKVKYKNQEVETFMCLFCAKWQDDWADLLPATVFTLNSHVHSTTCKSPFELVYSYCLNLLMVSSFRSQIVPRVMVSMMLVTCYCMHHMVAHCFCSSYHCELLLISFHLLYRDPSPYSISTQPLQCS